MLRAAGDSLAYALPVTAAMLLIGAIGSVLVSVVGVTGYCVIVVTLFDRLRSSEPEADQPLGAPDAARPPALTRRWWAPWLIAAVALTVTVGLSALLIESMNQRDVTEVTAHRGSSRHAPENTLAAIRRSIEDGADYAEIDVQLSGDGVVVVIHDADLMRVAGENLRVADATADELAAVDVGSWFDPRFHDQRVPTLAQAIEAAGDRVRLNIELKVGRSPEQLAAAVVSVVEQTGFADRCVITSLDLASVLHAKRLNRDLRVGYIVAQSVGDLMGLPVDFLSVRASLFTPSLHRANRRASKPVHVWTVNDAAQMNSLLDRHVSNIITDEPALLVEQLKVRAALNDAQFVLMKLRRRLLD